MRSFLLISCPAAFADGAAILRKRKCCTFAGYVVSLTCSRIEEGDACPVKKTREQFLAAGPPLAMALWFFLHFYGTLYLMPAADQDCGDS